MMKDQFEMVAKTFQGLEDVLAEELRGLGAVNVEPGKRMVSFEGDMEMLYKANLCCRTALRILKPIYKFTAKDTDTLYEMVKEYDWGQILTIDKSFMIDTVAYSDEFTHSRFVTYRVKDAIVDWFKDRYGEDKRPGVRLQDADVMLNVHISGDRVTISLDSSGESLHRRGYRVAQTEAPINEVLAAGIILKSGWRGDCPFVDPMCGSGTFLIEAALIAANINPGIYRRGFAFENWKDFDPEVFDRIYNDDSNERVPQHRIVGADMSPKAIAIAEKNIKSAGVAKYIDLEIKPLSQWEEAPANGVLITNPPYGQRIGSDDMDGLYELIGSKLKNVFKGYHAWIIGYHREYFDRIGLASSSRTPILNGDLECELREYVIFEGNYKDFRRAGGQLREGDDAPERIRQTHLSRPSDRQWRRDAKEKGFGGRDWRELRKRMTDGGDRDDRHQRRDDRPNKLEERYGAKPRRESRSDRARGREERFAADRREARKNYPFDRRDRREAPAPEPESENPLAKRRNVFALRSIQGKQPSLPSAEGPTMRPRRGWKKTDDEADKQ